jgi:hypothetical protein
MERWCRTALIDIGQDMEKLRGMPGAGLKNTI